MADLSNEDDGQVIVHALAELRIMSAVLAQTFHSRSHIAIASGLEGFVKFSSRTLKALDRCRLLKRLLSEQDQQVSGNLNRLLEEYRSVNGNEHMSQTLTSRFSSSLRRALWF